ncbi:hypothetical protein RHGRI_037985 [Rhododendron griersonianum]|uniref:F-box protein n=1 Tax=Rhododendron griersonianum TaxID=479676 RepID=A0AAV6HXR4_9ERIC|nr:hypothetical protein RHGRI_037985 [Rhododendron griersonianum]
MEHWAKKKKNEEAENQFQRLPDDVVLNIFHMVSDIKWLCRCFMPLRFFYNAYYPFPSSRLNFLDLVFQLKQIQSLNLEFISDFNGDDDSVFKWGAKFTAGIDSFTFLYSKSLSRMMESEDEEDATENEIAQEELFRRVKLAMRNTLDTKTTISSERAKTWWQEQGNARVGYVPVLHLPISGYVMKGVTILNFKMSVNDFEADTAMLDAFAEEQGPFLEAVVQILEKHKDNIKAFS